MRALGSYAAALKDDAGDDHMDYGLGCVGGGRKVGLHVIACLSVADPALPQRAPPREEAPQDVLPKSSSTRFPLYPCASGLTGFMQQISQFIGLVLPVVAKYPLVFCPTLEACTCDLS